MSDRSKSDAGVRALQGLAGILLMVGIWWLLTVPFTPADSMGQRFAPGPALTALYELLKGGEIWIHIVVSLQRVAIGLFFALLVGVPLGLLLGASNFMNATLSPAFQFLRMISPLSWMPIAVMAFGVGDKPVYFLLAFAAMWPIMLNTLAGVKQLDRRWLQLSQSLSATHWETLKGVVLPGVLGHILTGTRLAIGIVWIVLVPCEMLGVSAGLGYFILDTRDRLAYNELMATVVLIGLLGFLLDTGFRKLYSLWNKH
ncbi:MAG TPA: ABC transporter permease [Alcaligenaceae bacterium]|nr:ABC transporter permease [Alcaligenaceae bacterium]